MKICITGTPGTGKTTLAKKLANKLGFKYINLNDLVISLSKEYDEERNSYIIDENLLNNLEIEDNSIVDGHLSHFLDCDVLVLLRCSPEILKQRLKKRNYNERKINENVEAEAMGIIKEEIEELGKEYIEINTSNKTVDDVVNLILKLIDDGNFKYKEEVDFSWYL